MKKIVISFAVVLLLLVGAVVAVPFLFKDKINAAVKAAINENVNAKVDYGDFSLSLIRSFPNFSFSLNDLSVTGVNDFKGDTLTHINNISFTVDLMSVIEGKQYKLISLVVDEPNVFAKVNYKGKANWDIMKPSPETKKEETKFSAQLKKILIKKGLITYNDLKGGIAAKIVNLNFEGSGDVTQDLYILETLTGVDALTVKSGGVAYLNDAKLNAKLDVEVDSKNSKYTFKENEISLNALALGFDGFVQTISETVNLDVKFKTKQAEFKSILSMIPAVYKKDFDKVKTSGKLVLDGSIKGKYLGEDYPAFNLNLKVDNAMFQYPALPTAVRNIQIATKVDKPQGKLDLTVIDVQKLHADLGSDPIDARIKVRTPISDPNVDATVKGSLNLANIPKLYPLEGVKTITGLLALNIDFKGRQSDIDNKRYETIKASGNATVTNLVYDGVETPMPVKVSNLQLAFNPRNVTLSNLSAVLGRSDIQASGTLDNFLAYAFGKGDLVGVINLKSNVFDANQFIGKDEKPQTKKDTVTEFFRVPKAIDFTANSQFGKIFYEKLVLSNVSGVVKVKDEALNLNNLFANLLGGSANISARYNTKQQNYPDVTFSYDIKNFDFQETFKFVELADKMAPIMKHIQGNFSSDLKGSGKLNPDMSIDLASLKGDGKVEIPTAKIVNMPILQKIGEVTKISALSNPELKNAWTVLKFKDGRVAVEPTNIKLGNYNVALQGTNGFDQSIDYDIRFDVPQSELGAASSLAQNMIAKVPGVPFKMPDVVSFSLKATGTASKPQIKLAKVGTGEGKSVGETVKEQVVEQVKEQVDVLKQNAQDELNKQKAAAEQRAREEAEKAKQEAERKAKEALDKAKKDAEQKVKDVFKKPW
jgi:hypothetical protein